MLFNQCVLKRKIETGHAIQTTFIPKKFAVLNSHVRLKENDQWTNGWRVDFVGPDIHEDVLPDSYAEIKGHRKMTGDSLRK